ncbi:hypothetical protein [Sphingopyxis kveilinensis]|uniref:hypothetical protein n=1 Tax=Sphingopyxis kveilinensis TaxID=3114367 RepID=UPI0030CB7C6E
MELFGTPDNRVDPRGGVGRLTEATLYLDPTEMKKLADFLNKCAKEASTTEIWDHEHFVDYLLDASYSGPDIIVYRS